MFNINLYQKKHAPLNSDVGQNSSSFDKSFLKKDGGFKIRLSHNELQSTRIIQEKFNLNSTVAVLGFALRALAILIKENKIDELEELIKTQINVNKTRTSTQLDNRRGSNANNNGSQKPNPFARPSKSKNTADIDEQKARNDFEPSAQDKLSIESNSKTNS